MLTPCESRERYRLTCLSYTVNKFPYNEIVRILFVDSNSGSFAEKESEIVFCNTDFSLGSSPNTSRIVFELGGIVQEFYNYFKVYFRYFQRIYSNSSLILLKKTNDVFGISVKS